jgi:hypothetical protein
MMPTLPDSLESQFRSVVSDAIDLLPEGDSRYRIFTPFTFDDGDHIVIVLKLENVGWVLSDEGHTFMHLSYSLEERSYQTGTRQKIIENTLSMYRIENRGGELVVTFEQRSGTETKTAGNVLYDFIQAILKISDVTFLSRDRVQTTFTEDFRALIANTVPANRRAFEWFNHNLDPKGHYKVDVYVNGSTSPPLAIYALSSDLHVRDATISLLKFEQWGLHVRSLGVFEDQEEIARDVLARFTDVCERQFSNLAENRDRIAKFIIGNLSL